MGLAGKRVLITGGSRGIGLACAEAFAREGCDLVLAARGVYRKFCVWGLTMLLKEPSYAATQTACHPG